jgi:uncharacterized membrane protein (DUF4010 family)
MTISLTAQSLIVLLGMSLFFGLAFEGFFADQPRRPGGIRAFPMLALAGAGAYCLEPHTGLIFATGLAVVGLWLFAYYQLCPEKDRDFIVPVSNMLAYLIGAIAVTQPPWVTVAVAVAATMLLAGRARLHEIAQELPLKEIFTAGQFLLLAGVGLPLLPDTPVAGIPALTPHKILLAVVAVSALSYASYLLLRYVRPKGATLLSAILGGLYSSTATTVVLARRSREEPANADLSAGIVFATAFMFVRLLVVVAVFNLDLARTLAIPLLALAAIGALMAGVIHRAGSGQAAKKTEPADGPGNPLELGTAVLFAFLFVLITVATEYVRGRFGRSGLDGLAAIVGFTDIDPFVLSVVQGNAGSVGEVGEAILIAAASNNVLKAVYAIAFGGARRLALAAAVLLVLAGASLGAGLLVGALR